MNFVKICTESTVGSDLVIFLIIAEVLAVGINAWGWWIEARMRKEGNEKGHAIAV